MKKLIGRLLAIVLIAALAVCGIVTYNGYRLYKEVTEAVPVQTVAGFLGRQMEN